MFTENLNRSIMSLILGKQGGIGPKEEEND